MNDYGKIGVIRWPGNESNEKFSQIIGYDTKYKFGKYFKVAILETNEIKSIPFILFKIF